MKPQDLDHIRALNRRKILECIRDAGAISRVEISDLVDVSQATVSVVTGELLADGLIETVKQESGVQTLGRGRPKTLLRLNPDATYAIGIKVSLHQAAASVTNFVGNVLATETVPITPENRTPDKVIELCEMLITRMLGRCGLNASQLLGVGIGFSGCVEYETGSVIWTPMFADRGVPLKSAVEKRMGVNVVVDNEANLAGLAEKWFGLGRSNPTFVLATLEHGVGMSIVIDNQIYRGARGFAGEFGHTIIEIGGRDCRCGKSGCVEAYVADYALVRDARALVGHVPIRDQRAVETALDDLALKANSGDREAEQIFRRAGEIFGLALANVATLFDPPVVIISGQRAAHPARAFVERLQAAFAENVMCADSNIPAIEISEAGDDVWARGAAALVLEEFLPDNTLTGVPPADPDRITDVPIPKSA